MIAIKIGPGQGYRKSIAWITDATICGLHPLREDGHDAPRSRDGLSNQTGSYKYGWKAVKISGTTNDIAVTAIPSGSLHRFIES